MKSSKKCVKPVFHLTNKTSAFREVHGWTRVHMNPLWKTHFEIQKNSKKREGGHLHILCVCRKSHGKNNFFCSLCKKDKILCRETLFRSSRICLFYWDKTKILFYTKLCAVNIPLPTCMHNLFLEFLDITKHVKSTFLKSGCRCPMCRSSTLEALTSHKWYETQGMTWCTLLGGKLPAA